MLKNDEIRQMYPFFRKGLNDFEASVVACTKFAKESEKTIVALWMLSIKSLFLTA